jgi:hypothetical protein
LIGHFIVYRFPRFISLDPFPISDRAEEISALDLHNWTQVGGRGRSADQQRAPYDNEINKFHRRSLWRPGRFYNPNIPVRHCRLKTNNSSHQKAQIDRPPR